MMSRIDSKDEDDSAPWSTPQTNGAVSVDTKPELEMPSLIKFSSMLEADDEDYWPAAGCQQVAVHGGNASGGNTQPLLQPVDYYSSSSCSTNLDPFQNQVNYLLPPNLKTLNRVQFGGNGISDYCYGSDDFDYFGAQLQPEMCNPNLSYNNTQVGDFDAFGLGNGVSIGGNSFPFNRANNKILQQPLNNLASFGAQLPTLFQKRAALLRENLENHNIDSDNNLGAFELGSEVNEIIINDKKRKTSSSNVVDDDDMLDISNDDGSNNCESDDQVMLVNNGDHKRKNKGLPAKNLMAERRRRKKLNDRLYMLRSVVPKISKMDRASILGDAIDYLKELLQKINVLQNELESIPCVSSPTSSISLHPTPSIGHLSTPTTSRRPARIKEEGGQPARVEVKLQEGKAVNIHMFCGFRPGLLLSTVRAVDNLGLDIQQAVISCFNGFALDVFRAEQNQEDEAALHADEIKAALLDAVGFHGIM